MPLWRFARSTKTGVFALSIALVHGCSQTSSSADQVKELLNRSVEKRTHSDPETAIPIVKEACLLAERESDSEAGCTVKRQAYEEAIKVAVSLQEFGRIKPARELLKTAALLQGHCGIAGDDQNSASNKLSQLNEAEVQESEIFETAATTKKASGAYTARKEAFTKVFQHKEKGDYAGAEKIALKLMSERKSREDYTSDSGYREAFSALKAIYLDQQKYAQATKLLRQDATIQKQGFTQKELDAAEHHAFFKARLYGEDQIELAKAESAWGHPKEALTAFSEGERIMRAIVKPIELQPTLSAKATILEQFGKWEEAIKLRREVLKTLKQNHMDRNYYDELLKLAFDLERNRQLADAVQVHMSVMSYLKLHPELEFAPSHMVEAAIVALRNKDKALSDSFLRQARIFLERERPPHDVGHYYATLGHLRYELALYEEAIRNFRQSIRYFEKSSVSAWRDTAKEMSIHIARAYKAQRNYNAAFKTLSIALKDKPTTAAQKTRHFDLLLEYANTTHEAGFLEQQQARVNDVLAYMEHQPVLPKTAPGTYAWAARRTLELELLHKRPHGTASSSQQLLNKAFESAQKLKLSPLEMAHLNFTIGIMYYELVGVDTSRKYFEDALKLFDEDKGASDYVQYAAECWRILALIQWRAEYNLKSAREKFLRAVDVLKDKESTVRETCLNVFLDLSRLDAELFYVTKDANFIKEAEVFSRRACAFMKGQRNQIAYAAALFQQANVYMKIPDYKQASLLLDQAEKIARKNDSSINYELLPSIKSSQASIACSQNDKTRAKTLLSEGISAVRIRLKRKPTVDCKSSLISLIHVSRRVGMADLEAQLKRELKIFLDRLPMSPREREHFIKLATQDHSY